MRVVIEALMSLALKPAGFSVSDLATKVIELTGWTHYGIRQAAYDLRKIRGKAFIEQQNNSRRYLVSSQGFQTMCALLILREKVFKPVLLLWENSGGVQNPKKYVLLILITKIFRKNSAKLL